MKQEVEDGLSVIKPILLHDPRESRLLRHNLITNMTNSSQLVCATYMLRIYAYRDIFNFDVWLLSDDCSHCVFLCLSRATDGSTLGHSP